jgi:hypothetical protein
VYVEKKKFAWDFCRLIFRSKRKLLPYTHYFTALYSELYQIYEGKRTDGALVIKRITRHHLQINTLFRPRYLVIVLEFYTKKD